jgi:hypothetical protein
LKDSLGQEATLGVASSRWDKLMELFKPPALAKRQLRSLSASSPLAARLLLDSVSYGANTAGVTAGAAPVIVTPPPVAAAAVVTPAPQKAAVTVTVTVTPETITKVVTSDCDFPEVANAAISGVAVPLIAWSLVKMYKDMRHPKDKLDEGSLAYTLMLVAAVAIIAVGAVCTAVVRIFLTPICSSSDHDVYIVALSCFAATLTTSVIALYYLGKNSKEHVSGAKQQKFMIVATDDDGNTEIKKSHEMVSDHAHDSVMTPLKTKN